MSAGSIADGMAGGGGGIGDGLPRILRRRTDERRLRCAAAARCPTGSDQSIGIGVP
jgi:hypothetical protein